MTAPGSTTLSFAAFYRAEHARLFRYFRRRVGDNAAADLAQEAFARLLRGGALERADNPAAYLTRIARNLLIDHARQRQRGPVACYPLDDERDGAVRPDQSWRIEVADLFHLYRQTVRSMPPKTRRVFVMHRARHRTYKDISEALGISVATVEYHMVRALTLCRGAVAAQW